MGSKAFYIKSVGGGGSHYLRHHSEQHYYCCVFDRPNKEDGFS